MTNGNSTAARKARAAGLEAKRLVAATERQRQREAARERAAEGLPPRAVGRPARGEAAAPLYVRVTTDERSVCEFAAQREGKTLSEWARNTLLLRAAAVAP